MKSENRKKLPKNYRQQVVKILCDKGIQIDTTAVSNILRGHTKNPAKLSEITAALAQIRKEHTQHLRTIDRGKKQARSFF